MIRRGFAFGEATAAEYVVQKVAKVALRCISSPQQYYAQAYQNPGLGSRYLRALVFFSLSTFTLVRCLCCLLNSLKEDLW